MHTHYHTMVPDLRVTMKVGADSMTDEVRTHLETTSLGYFAASRRQKNDWRTCWSYSYVS